VTSVEDPKKRGAWGRGSVRKHHGSYEVRVTAGKDPVTGERLNLTGTASTEREAEKLRAKLLAEADEFGSARTAANLTYLLDKWLPQHDVDENTRTSYESLIRNHIKPALGDVSLTTLARKATEIVEQFYADLRRCRARCKGRTLIDHRASNQHDCAAAGCRPHQCLPHSPSTVGRIHVVLSAVNQLTPRRTSATRSAQRGRRSQLAVGPGTPAVVAGGTSSPLGIGHDDDTAHHQADDIESVAQLNGQPSMARVFHQYQQPRTTLPDCS
jgi:hypothetical protein